jgi:hypothetical protein
VPRTDRNSPARSFRPMAGRSIPLPSPDEQSRRPMVRTDYVMLRLNRVLEWICPVLHDESPSFRNLISVQALNKSQHPVESTYSLKRRQMVFPRKHSFSFAHGFSRMDVSIHHASTRLLLLDFMNSVLGVSINDLIIIINYFIRCYPLIPAL